MKSIERWDRINIWNDGHGNIYMYKNGQLIKIDSVNNLVTSGGNEK